ncbi:GGDEF domain-containing protein [Metabacillus malikii]|nr:GGDEF domain-containing protein [Metabacillus malikii]
MFPRIESLNDLKRVIYLCVIPLFQIALGSNILHFLRGNHQVVLIIDVSVFLWFLLCWVFLYKKRFVNYIEMINLVIVFIMFTALFINTVNNGLNENGFGTYIIWSPFFIGYIFITLKEKQAIFVMSLFLVITIVSGVLVYEGLNELARQSIIQFYFAHFVYGITMVFSRHIIRAYNLIESMKKEAYYDFLTGIANRVKVNKLLEINIKESEINNNIFSVLFFDIDRFKHINDQYGHDIGDAILKELAKLIQDNLETNELFGRWGGEEFIIISRKGLKDAVRRAELIREIVEGHAFSVVKSVTISFGVTSYTKGDTIQSILKRADIGLYESKNNGRNLVTSK